MTGGHTSERRIGRYALYGEIASGGMATVHFGRLLGPAGFARTVAIKRLHPHFAKDPDFATMFLDEARLAARIKHPNVVPIVDVISEGDDLLLVMDYVHGESLSRIMRALERKHEKAPLKIVSSVICGALHGLHAAHEAVDERGAPLGLVHRDVSPQNVLVGADGATRVLDFGVAKAMGRAQVTREGQLKGKFAYMAPEQIQRGNVDRRADIFAAAVVLWEMLTMRRLFNGDSELAIIAQVTMSEIQPPSQIGVFVPSALEAVVMRGLARSPDERFQTAREMAMALESAVPVASSWEVAEWVAEVAKDALARRGREVQTIEHASLVDIEAPPSMQRGDGSVDAGSMPSAVGSQVSGLAVPQPARPSAAPRWPLLVASGAVLVALGAVGALLLGRSHDPELPEAASSASTPVSAAPLPTTPASTAEAPPDASAPVATASAPAPSPTPTPTPQATSKPATTTKATSTPPPVKTTTTPPPRAKNCNPPYTIDAKGIRRIKPECL